MSRRIEPRHEVADAALASGDLNAWKQVLGFPRASAVENNRTGEASAPLDIVNIKPSDPGTVVIGRVTGTEYEGNQVQGMPGAICHACGLKNYPCVNPDCPNKSDPGTVAVASTNQGTPHEQQ